MAPAVVLLTTHERLFIKFYLEWHKLMDIHNTSDGAAFRGWGDGSDRGIWRSPLSRRHLTDAHVFDHIAFVSFDK